VGDCGNLDDVDNWFLTCEFLGNLWFDIYNWLGFITVHLGHVVEAKSLISFKDNKPF